MELKEVVDKLKELGDLPSYSSSDKSEIERLYKEVLGKEFTKTSCNDCYRDAVIEMTVYIKKNNRMKEKCNYILKMVSCFNRSSEAIKCTLMITSLMKLLKSTLPKSER